MKKLSFISLVLVILLLSSSICPVYGTTGDVASAGLKFIEQSAEDKEWAAIREIVNEYELGYVAAVSKGNFSAVEPYITPGSAFYTQQKNLVSSLFKKGTKEKLVNYSLEKTEYLKEKYQVYVVEEIEVTTPGKAAKLNKYVWIYDINKTAKGLKIGAIAKWTDYGAYSEAASGRVKTNGYCIEDFGSYYGYLLTDSLNSLYIGTLKEISGTGALLEQQKQLITKMRGYGMGFELQKYRNIDCDSGEDGLSGTSTNRYIFRYRSADKSECMMELKLSFKLDEVRVGYTGYARILGMQIESMENILVPSSGKTLQSFIPKGWKLCDNASGDLNGDKLADIAAIFEQDRKGTVEDYGNAPERILAILIKQKDGNYKLAVSSIKAILKADEGGVFGDPYEAISIKNGVLSFSFYGGSNYRWGYNYKFRNQNNGWFLIGATLYEIYTGTGEYTTKDFNLSTGKETITKGVEGGKSTVQNISRGKKPLVDLKNFNAASMSESAF